MSLFESSKLRSELNHRIKGLAGMRPAVSLLISAVVKKPAHSLASLLCGGRVEPPRRVPEMPPGQL